MAVASATTVRQRALQAMTGLDEAVFEATATVINEETGEDIVTIDQRCVNVAITITARVNTGVDPSAAAATTEASILDGDFAPVLENPHRQRQNQHQHIHTSYQVINYISN
jgi:hypothetical protein